MHRPLTVDMRTVTTARDSASALGYRREQVGVGQVRSKRREESTEVSVARENRAIIPDLQVTTMNA